MRCLARQWRDLRFSAIAAHNSVAASMAPGLGGLKGHDGQCLGSIIRTVTMRLATCCHPSQRRVGQGSSDSAATTEARLAAEARSHRGDKPLAALPDLPRLKPAGDPVQFARWSALLAPTSTPESGPQRLRSAAREVATDPNRRATINRAGSPVNCRDTPERQICWDADARQMTEAVRQIGRAQ